MRLAILWIFLAGCSDGVDRADAAMPDLAGSCDFAGTGFSCRPLSTTTLLDCATDRSLCDVGGCALMFPDCETSDPPTPIRLGAVPMVIRTPAAPGADPECVRGCRRSVYAFNVIFEVRDPSLRRRNLRVRAPAPWKVSLGHEGYAPNVCDDYRFEVGARCVVPGDVQPTSCLTTYALGAGGNSVGISTEDPNAPSVEITVDVAPEVDGGGC